jgi:hypothetical protein
MASVILCKDMDSLLSVSTITGELKGYGTFFDELCLIMSSYLVKPFGLAQDKLRRVLGIDHTRNSIG